MFSTLWIFQTYPPSFFRRRHHLALEVLALRHQHMVLKRQSSSSDGHLSLFQRAAHVCMVQAVRTFSGESGIGVRIPSTTHR